MCVITMVNDGGLRAVLDTSDLISRELLALNRTKTKHFRPQDKEVHDLAKKAADILDVDDDSVRSGTKRHASRRLSELSVDSAAGPSKKMNLSLNTSEELKKAVSPLVEKMKKLDAAALLSLNPSKSSNGATLDSVNGLTVPPIHDRISPSYADDGSNIVRYLHVKEVPNRYSAGIFIFPPNAEIPLHDHPDMVVLSRVLYGELRVQSYDVLPSAAKKEEKVPSDTDEAKAKNEAAPKQSVFRSSITALKNFVNLRASYRGEKEDTQLETDSDSSCRNVGPNILQAKENLTPMGVEQNQGAKEDEPVNVLSAPHVTCLYPDEGNCHAFVAGPHGAAVLDILFPPYDGDDGRDCTFYEAKEALELSEADDVEYPQQPPSESASKKIAREYRLTPINQPDHFYCLSGVYGRFTSCEESGEKEESSGLFGIDSSICSLS